MSNQVLAIDIGNTTISYALFRGSRLLRSGYSQDAAIPNVIGFDLVVISSVVPQKTSVILKSLRRNNQKVRIWVVGQNIRLNVKMKYRRQALGADRLVNIYGAVQKYPLPVLIIDFGTAITFDYVSKAGIFLGGLIVPGLETSWKGLQDRAALLPKHFTPHLYFSSAAQVGRHKAFLASRDTRSAMYSGLLNGFGAMTDGLVERFKKKYGRKLTVLATGGAAPLISRYARGIDQVDSLHTLRSLNLIYQSHCHP